MKHSSVVIIFDLITLHLNSKRNCWESSEIVLHVLLFLSLSEMMSEFTVSAGLGSTASLIDG